MEPHFRSTYGRGSMAGGNHNEGWVDVQKNTFTRWANTHLSKKRMDITDVYEDLKDGLRLIALLQIVSRQQVAPKYNKHPKMRIQKLENLNLAFNFMARNGVTVTNIGSSDIVDGNSKLVLGLLWTIIKAYQVSDIAVDGVSGKDGLLLWCKRSLADYPTVEVNNFTTSWTSGLAFCALIHKHYPTLLDFDSLTAENAEHNVNLGKLFAPKQRANSMDLSAAFTLAESKFGIPQLLNVADVAGNPKPDDKSILTYVSLLFQEFASDMQKKKAITTICKAVGMAQRITELKTHYETSAPQLLDWYTTKISSWTAPEATASLATVQQALTLFNEYKRTERPTYEAAFVQLESCAGRWIAACKNNHRPDPTMTPALDEIAALRKTLQENEVQYETALRAHVLQCQQNGTVPFICRTQRPMLRTDAIMNTVLSDLVKLETWLDKVAAEFNETTLAVPSSVQAEEMDESLRFFETVEVPRYRHVLEKVQAAASTHLSEHLTSATTTGRIQEAEARFEATLASMAANKETVAAALVFQRQVDAVAKEMRASMKTLKNQLEEVDELIDDQNVHATGDASEDALAAMKAEFEANIFPRVDADVVAAFERDIASQRDILTQANRDADLAALDAFQKKVDALVAKRDAKQAELSQAVEDAQKRVTLSLSFAALATQVVDKAASTTAQINAAEGSLADQLANLLALDAAELHAATPETLLGLMEALEAVSDQLEALRVFSNAHTTETIQSCRALFSGVQSALLERQHALEKEIAMDRLGHITPTQLQEVQEVFNHFDVDKDGNLARDEFITACKALGFDMTEDECHNMFDELDADKSEDISLHEFSTFCAEQLQSGTTQGDVLAAFEMLAKDKTISREKVLQHFDSTVAEYLIETMPHLFEKQEEEDAEPKEVLDYNSFSAHLFQG
ncbi:alpha-actinin-1 [Achlya hypogyna]|uniref:Alpha-actinin-1 n=1 Tax=Achlya hypogyna TaxID=1202772 RepID=A0A1V9YHT9_ACHHY|nr:alpha-actinin-1 [Achlya hypogyna]